MPKEQNAYRAGFMGFDFLARGRQRQGVNHTSSALYTVINLQAALCVAFFYALHLLAIPMFADFAKKISQKSRFPP